MDDGIELL